MLKFFNKRTTLIVLSLISVSIILLFILPVSVPLIVALVTALILEPIVSSLQSKLNKKRHLSVLIVFICFVLFMGVGGYFISTKVITEAIKIVENAPQYINEISNAWLNIEERLTKAAKDLPEEVVDEISKQVQSFLTNTKNELVASVNINNLKVLLTNIPNYLISFLVYLIALFLFLLELPRLRIVLYRFLTEKTADKVHFMTSRLSYVVCGFLKAQLLVSVLIFIVSLLGLLIITPKLALTMSFIIWIVDFIPVIGSVVILGPWALFSYITGDISFGTQLTVLAAVLVIIRRTVEPKVMGTQIGLSPLSTLIAMYLGLKLFGLLGFIIGPLLLIALNSAKEAGIIKVNFKI